MSIQAQPINSVCVYCASSNAADPSLLADAATLGKLLAKEKLKLVYGGGMTGLMGAVASAAHEAGGRVLGIIPEFLTRHEGILEEVETVVVTSMHERKMMMFEKSDAFVVLPGGIGTLEEIVELMSWRRLALHACPIVFYNPGGFWDPLFELFHRFIEQRLLPHQFTETWVSVDDIDQVIPALRAMPTEVFAPGQPLVLVS